MDRMVYLAGVAGREIMRAQAVNANNLANSNTPGFREDLIHAQDLQVFGPGHASRAYSQSQTIGADMTPGALMATGRELDMSIKGQGWIAVQNQQGAEAYTRAGDLRVSSTGLLTNGAGHPIMGNNGGPITIPPFEKLDIGVDGTISIRPQGQEATALVVVDRIKLVNPPEQELRKGNDGLFTWTQGDVAPADANVSVVSGLLEGSNVNSVDAMVSMMELARKFELQIKMMDQAKKNDAASSKMMQMS